MSPERQAELNQYYTSMILGGRPPDGLAPPTPEEADAYLSMAEGSPGQTMSPTSGAPTRSRVSNMRGTAMETTASNRLTGAPVQSYESYGAPPRLDRPMNGGMPTDPVPVRSQFSEGLRNARAAGQPFPMALQSHPAYQSGIFTPYLRNVADRYGMDASTLPPPMTRAGIPGGRFNTAPSMMPPGVPMGPSMGPQRPSPSMPATPPTTPAMPRVARSIRRPMPQSSYQAPPPSFAPPSRPPSEADLMIAEMQSGRRTY
jgi:hypothetical protein